MQLHDLPPELLESVDRICLDFEDRWKANDPRAIESVLTQVPAACQPALLYELLRLELHYRNEQGDEPSAHDYVARFPAEADVIQACFASLRHDQPSVVDTEVQDVANDHGGGNVESGEAARYRIVRQHARGGLGEVFVAEDLELHRIVALKRIRDRFADDETARARFMLEAEVTGKLEHPGIVPVYGLGEYANGRPFYSMRFIQGQRFADAITELHATHDQPQSPVDTSLKLRVLLQHFISVCHSIMYAHSRGVLHRDIKPENILLGKYGETLVVDWGLAKVLGERDDHHRTGEEQTMLRSSGDSSFPTDAGSICGTLAYMSPEQASGDPDAVVPASDQFSLGATLFHLLSGRPPYDSKGTQRLEDVRAGRRRTFRALRHDVPKPLQQICNKALAFDPQQRYTTVMDLANDVQRWLADEPLAGQHEPWHDRVRRWSRKHRALTMTGILSIAVVACVSFAAFWFVRHAYLGEATAHQVASSARDAAESRLHQAVRAIDTWLFRAADVMKYYPSMQVARQQMLEQAAQDYDRLASEENATGGLLLAAAEAKNRLGVVYRILERPADAKAAFVSARQRLESLLPQSTDPLACRWELIDTDLRLASLSMHLSELNEAEAFLASAEHELKQVTDGEVDRVIFVRGHIHAERGRLLALTGNMPAAAEQFDLALTEFSRFSPQRRREWLKEVSEVKQLKASLLAATGKYEPAIEQLRRALSSFDQLVAEDPQSPAPLESRAACLIELGNVCRALDRDDECLVAYEAAMKDYDQLLLAMPDVPQFTRSKSFTLVDVGQLLLITGDAAAALVEIDAAVALLNRLIDHQAGIPQYREDLATAKSTRGQILRDLDRNAEAELSYKEAIAALDHLTREYPDIVRFRERLAAARSNLGQLLLKLGRNAAAQIELDKALEDVMQVLKQAVDVNLAETSTFELSATIYERLGELAHVGGQVDRARSSWREAVLQRSRLDATPDQLAALVQLLCETNDDSIRDPQRGLQVAAKLQQDHPSYRRGPLWQAIAHYRAGQFKEASASLDQIASEPLLHDARYLYYLAMALEQTGDHKAAGLTLGRANQWLDAHRPGNPDLLKLRKEAEKLIENK